VRPISYVIPFTYFVDIIRGLLIKKTLLVDLMLPFAALSGFVILFVTASIMKFRQTL
jgi:ABC-type multidrug transport system permease subunit